MIHGVQTSNRAISDTYKDADYRWALQWLIRNTSTATANLNAGAGFVARRHLLNLMKLLAAALHERRVESLLANGQATNGEKLSVVVALNGVHISSTSIRSQLSKILHFVEQSESSHVVVEFSHCMLNDDVGSIPLK